MQAPMAQDHAGQIHKEVFRAENQAKLDSKHAAFLLAHQSTLPHNHCSESHMDKQHINSMSGFRCATLGVEQCLDVIWSSASNRIHNVIIGLSGVQHVHAMLPAAGVNAFMGSLFSLQVSVHQAQT